MDSLSRFTDGESQDKKTQHASQTSSGKGTGKGCNLGSATKSQFPELSNELDLVIEL